MADPRRLDEALEDVSGIIHLAGVNRAPSAEEVTTGNIEAAQAIAAALRRLHHPLPVAFANSIQVLTDSVYGQAKARAADMIEEASSPICDVLLLNFFGEHGRPHYNSFVATFAHAVAHDEEPVITGVRQVPLLHVQEAAGVLIEAVLSGRSSRLEPAGELRGVRKVADLLDRIYRTYRTGEIPQLGDPFEVDLSNTYRSYRFPRMLPVTAPVHSDFRGGLVETVRLHGGRGQGFISTTHPGRERGNHYHLRKFERFFVVKGDAEISLRRLLHDEVVCFRISGGRPASVDMPTLWTHNLRNVGQDELVTAFWSDQLLDPERPDHYAGSVESAVAA